MDTIRVGIVGAGRNTTSRHIPGLQAIDGVEIVSVCNRGRESSERVAQQWGIPKIYNHWWDLVAAPDTDAIVIGTWPYLHCPVTLAVLAADKHVLCEARMALNLQEASTMLKASREKPHLIAQLVPPAITLRVAGTVKRLLAEGYLGEILAIDVRGSDGAFLDREAPLDWRQDAALSGLNVMRLGIWYEIIMRWVGEATRVMAMGKTFVKMRLNPGRNTMQAVRIPEHLNVIADMACGAQASFFISNVAGLAAPSEVFLFGSKGTIRFSQGKLYSGRRDDSTLQEITIPPGEEGGWRVEEEFINAIRGRETVTHSTFEDGVKYMAFTEAVARSMAEGRGIPLPL